MVSKKGVARFSVSLPPTLVDDFDDSWKSTGYENRSKAAHDAFRAFITENKWNREEGEEIAGTVTLLYYLDKPGLLNHIVEAQHKFENIVLSSMHLHLTENKCMEIIAVKGKAADVKSLSQELMTKKGVKQLRLTVMAL
jgi:CopG family transcriptional regulator, nickel-responsive regulator